MPEVKTVLLGAGASRSVSYAHQGEMLSPLDADFFDLLQRITAKDEDRHAIDSVLKAVRELGASYRRSLERAFYTLHLNAYLREKLRAEQPITEEALLENFARALQAVLRKAHGKQTCTNHQRMFERLRGEDAIVSFNYDLVVERALRSRAQAANVQIGPELYGLEERKGTPTLPTILKLHGSANWRITDDPPSFEVRTSDWDELDEKPGYRGHSGVGTTFPILLPLWDKRIEEKPWLTLWKQAYRHLTQTSHLVVWGYSLAPTDIKAQQLFRIALPAAIKLCVIDPSPDTRQRWRELLPTAQYWEYTNIDNFLQYPPTWWEVGKKKRATTK